MSKARDPVADAVQRFMDGAKTLHLGYFLDSRRIEDKGFALISGAIAKIDESSATGRDVLLPLLEDHDEGVRVTAAAGLWQSHPDRVIPTLTDLQINAVTEASRLAIILLMTRGQMNPCGSDPRYPTLDFAQDDPRHWTNEPPRRPAAPDARGVH